MAKPKRIQIKSKPSKPVRYTLDVRYEVGEAKSLKDIVDWAYEYTKDLSKVLASHYYESSCFVIKVPEPDEKYAERMKGYEKDLEKYNEWYNENKDEILAQEKAIKESEKRTLELKLKEVQKKLKQTQDKLKEYD